MVILFGMVNLAFTVMVLFRVEGIQRRLDSEKDSK